MAAITAMMINRIQVSGQASKAALKPYWAAVALAFAIASAFSVAARVVFATAALYA